MIEALITVLIYIVLLAVCVYLIMWVIEVIGLSLPPKVVQLIWVAVALIALLLLVRVLVPRLALSAPLIM